MTQKEFRIIDLIQREGIENSSWGLQKETVNSVIYGSFVPEDLPPHIYIYGSYNESYTADFDALLKDYDKIFYCGKGDFLCLYWLNGMIN